MGKNNTNYNRKNQSTSVADGVTTVVQTIISVSFNVLIVAVLVMLILNYSGKAYAFGQAIFTDEAVSDAEHAKSIVVTIPKGSNNKKVAQILEKADLIDDKNVFLVQIMLSDYKNDIHPGTYTLSTGDKPSQLIEKMAKTEKVVDTPEEGSSAQETPTEEVRP